jgi:hypothetical protein
MVLFLYHEHKRLILSRMLLGLLGYDYRKVRKLLSFTFRIYLQIVRPLILSDQSHCLTLFATCECWSSFKPCWPKSLPTFCRMWMCWSSFELEILRWESLLIVLRLSVCWSFKSCAIYITSRRWFKFAVLPWPMRFCLRPALYRKRVVIALTQPTIAQNVNRITYLWYHNGGRRLIIALSLIQPTKSKNVN